MIGLPRGLRFDVALPDSLLYGLTSDIDKTTKIFQISRSLSIFRVENLLIYHDKLSETKNRDLDFIVTLLEYLDTPPYLRKKIYPKIDILRYAGKLHPLRTPHHKDKVSLKDIRHGDIRVGLLEKNGTNLYVDVGLDTLIPYEGEFKKDSTKINIKLVYRKKFLIAIDASKDEIDKENYWGYKILTLRSLSDVLAKYSSSHVVLTSRYSRYFNSSNDKFLEILKSIGNKNEPLLIVFGSPKYGLNEILKKEKTISSKYISFNFFPNQGTQTIRLEESIIGVLSILNSYYFS